MFKVQNDVTTKFYRDTKTGQVKTWMFEEHAKQWADMLTEMSAKQADPALNDLVAETFSVVPA